jgi:hypothetical protein
MEINDRDNSLGSTVRKKIENEEIITKILRIMEIA